MYQGKCRVGQTSWSAERNGQPLLMPEDFQCKNAFWNPQYPVYVCCKQLALNGGEGCLCGEFRDARREDKDRQRIPMDSYIKMLKRLSEQAPLDVR